MNPVADSANAKFWDELCGSWLARREGINGRSAADLSRFDLAYLGFYPYLLEYLAADRFEGKAVLEIGLGYGTIGQRLAGTAASYCGVDLADGPASVMASRLRHIGAPVAVARASARSLPFADHTFDWVVSIGCLHHTGSLAQSINEVHRVLKPGGQTLVMVYSQFSYRQWTRFPLRTIQAAFHELVRLPSDHPTSEAQRRLYDLDSLGIAAPQTVLVSRRQVRSLFRRFSDIRVRAENCDDVVPGGSRLQMRRRMLWTLGRTLGLDLYVVARK